MFKLGVVVMFALLSLPGLLLMCSEITADESAGKAGSVRTRFLAVVVGEDILHSDPMAFTCATNFYLSGFGAKIRGHL